MGRRPLSNVGGLYEGRDGGGGGGGIAAACLNSITTKRVIRFAVEASLVVMAFMLLSSQIALSNIHLNNNDSSISRESTIIETTSKTTMTNPPDGYHDSTMGNLYATIRTPPPLLQDVSDPFPIPHIDNKNELYNNNNNNENSDNSSSDKKNTADHSSRRTRSRPPPELPPDQPPPHNPEHSQAHRQQLKLQPHSQRPPPQLQIAWLMSYPNSGTSYTLQLIQSATQTQTATNYATKRTERRLRKQQQQQQQGNNFLPETPTRTKTIAESRPVFPQEQPMGPFWGTEEGEGELSMPLPQYYALTKTHCGPPCIWCPPTKYVQLLHYFIGRCRRAERVVLVDEEEQKQGNDAGTPATTTPTTPTTTTTTRNVTNVRIQKDFYPTTRVTKSIHLIRDPLDNAVSRFRYERLNGRTAMEYPNSRQGFRDYCHKLDSEFQSHYRAPGLKLVESSLRSVLFQIPCYSELIRYVEWHNMAFVTEWDLNLDSLVIHYSDYQASTFNQTLARLLDFLHFTPIHQEGGTTTPGESQSPPKQLATFIESKTYRQSYYTGHEQNAAWVLLQQMALRTTWQHLRRYDYRDSSSSSSSSSSP